MQSKYHFRRYRLSQNHPFLVALVTEEIDSNGKTLISGGKISDDTINSALLISKNRIDLIVRIILPLSLKSLISSFGFTFSVSAGDTSLPLVLGIPKFNTLSLFTYGLASAYRFNEACASGLILGLICIITYSFATLQKKNHKN